MDVEVVVRPKRSSPRPQPDVNTVLRSLGARVPVGASPAVLGAVDDRSEHRAELTADSASTRIVRRSPAPSALSVPSVPARVRGDEPVARIRAAEPSTRPPAAPAGTRIRRSAAIDRFADTIDAEAFTVGRDIFMSSSAGDDTLAHELSHVADNESTARPVIRRRVRSTLRSGSNRFRQFKSATERASTLYVQVADDMYNEYRPWQDAPPVDTVMTDPAVDGSTDAVVAAPVDGAADGVAEPMELDAKQEFERSDDPGAAKRRLKRSGPDHADKKASYGRRATRLSNWATGAVQASEFLLNELAVTHRFAQAAAADGTITPGAGISPLAHIHPGDSNTSEADMNLKISTVPVVGGAADQFVAIEVKTPVSKLHSTIGSNLTKAAYQLAKRHDFEGGSVAKYVAIIDVVNDSDFSGAQAGQDPAAVIKARAEKAAAQAAGQIARELVKQRKTNPSLPDGLPVPKIDWIVRVKEAGANAEYRHTTEPVATDASKAARLKVERSKKAVPRGTDVTAPDTTPALPGAGAVAASRVRSALRGGHEQFVAFGARVDAVNQMYNEVATALYDAYRPWMDRPAVQVGPDKVARARTDRAKTVGNDELASFERSRDDTRVRQSKTEDRARRFAAQADRFAHWAERAANASEYLYSELSSTVEFVLDPTLINPLNPQPKAAPRMEQRVTRNRSRAEQHVARPAPVRANIDDAEASKRRAAIHAGGDTKGEADMTVVQGTRTIAVEIKAPVTDTASAIDEHISKAILQLAKRATFNPGDGARRVTDRVAVIDIRQPTNQFPYTPTTQDDRSDPAAKAKQRISERIDAYTKDGEGVPPITWVIKSAMYPNIPSFRTEAVEELRSQPKKKRSGVDRQGDTKRRRREQSDAR